MSSANSSNARGSLLRNLWRNLMLLLNLAAIAWFWGCYLNTEFSPADVPYLQLLSITTPFAVAANLLYILYWLFTSRKLVSLLSLVSLVCGYHLLIAIFGIHFSKEPQQAGTGPGLRVLTWNVHGLGIHNKPLIDSVPVAIASLIRDQEPDLVCLPEFYANKSNALKPYTDTFLKIGKFREYRFVQELTLGTRVVTGTACFSKYPLLHTRMFRLADRIQLLQTDVALPEDTFRLFCAHLQSFLLADKEKRLIEDVEHQNRDMQLSESKSFVRKFQAAYLKRALQAEELARIVSVSPYPVIVCGDLNDLPGSYTYGKVKGRLADAFVMKGRGFGRTYNQLFPTLRIDYIFYDSSAMQAHSCTNILTGLSDHNPVIAEFGLR